MNTETDRFALPNLWLVLLFISALIMGGVISFSNRPLYPTLLIALGFLAIVLILIALLTDRVPFFLFVMSLAFGEILETNALPTTLLILPGAYAFGSWVHKVLLRREPVVLERWSFMFVGGLGLWAIFSSLNAQNFGTIRTYWFVIGLFLLTQNVLRKEKDFIHFGWVLAASLALVGGYVFFARAQIYLRSGGLISVHALHIAELSVGDKNTVGMWITMGMPFAYYYNNLPMSTFKRLLLRFFLILMILGALSTVSIGVTLGMGVMLFLAFIYSEDARGKLLLFLSVVLIVGFAISGPLAERLRIQQLRIEDEGFSALGTGRIQLWSASIQAIMDSPAFGYGAGSETSTDALSKYLPFEFVQMKLGLEKYIVPHNIFLAVGLQLGLFGILFLSLLLISLLVPLWKATQYLRNLTAESPNLAQISKAIFISLSGALVQAMGLTAHLDHYIWLLLGASASFLMLVRFSPGRKLH
jgi:O-antigen ligase